MKELHIAYIIGNNENTSVLWQKIDKPWHELPISKMHTAYFVYEIFNDDFKIIKSTLGYNFKNESDARNAMDKWAKNNPIPFSTDPFYDYFEYRTGEIRFNQYLSQALNESNHQPSYENRTLSSLNKDEWIAYQKYVNDYIEKKLSELNESQIQKV